MDNSLVVFDPVVFYLVIVGIPLILILILTAIFTPLNARFRRDLDLNGKTVTATITTITVSGDAGRVVRAQWVDPQTQTVFAFEGNTSNVYFSPSTPLVEGGPVEIVFDPRNPHRYYFR